LSGVSREERDLVSKLVVYESANRLTAEEVCRADSTRLHTVLIHVTGVAAPLLQPSVMFWSHRRI